MEDQISSVSKSHDTDKDFFAEIYRQYQASKYIKELHTKYTARPYYVQHKYTRVIALYTSYLFNVFSGITACVPVYFLIFELTGFKAVALSTTAVFLLLFESTKRLIAVNFSKDYVTKNRLNPVLFLSMIVLIFMSIGLSYSGGKKLVKISESPPPVVVEDPQIPLLDERIKTLTEQLDAARATKYLNGTTTRESRKTIAVLTEQIAGLDVEKQVLKNEDRSKKTKAETTREQQLISKQFWFPLCTLGFEIWFLFSIWYIEYFDWRCWVEFEGVRGVHEASTHSTHDVYTQNDDIMQSSTGENDEEEIDVNYLKSRIATAKYRLKNGIGKEETNRKNLKVFEFQLQQAN